MPLTVNCCVTNSVLFLRSANFVLTTSCWVLLTIIYKAAYTTNDNKILTWYWIYVAVSMAGGLHYILYTIYHILKKIFDFEDSIKIAEEENNRDTTNTASPNNVSSEHSGQQQPENDSACGFFKYVFDIVSSTK